MKKVFGKLIAVAMAMVMIVGMLALSACGENNGVDGTYTTTVVTDMGDNQFTLTLSNGKDAQMTIKAGPINDSYFGTYTAEGNEVSIEGLNNPNNQNSQTPGLWNDIIDAKTGNCKVTLNVAEKLSPSNPQATARLFPLCP